VCSVEKLTCRRKPSGPSLTTTGSGVMTIGSCFISNLQVSGLQPNGPGFSRPPLLLATGRLEPVLCQVVPLGRAARSGAEKRARRPRRDLAGFPQFQPPRQAADSENVRGRFLLRQFRAGGEQIRILVRA
jgi:hypothetical protein